MLDCGCVTGFWVNGGVGAGLVGEELRERDREDDNTDRGDSRCAGEGKFWCLNVLRLAADAVLSSLTSLDTLDEREREAGSKLEGKES